MGKLIDIKIYHNSSLNHHIDNNRWEGKIILEEDNWFEGIVKENNDCDSEDNLIMGIYNPNSDIELFLFSPKFDKNVFLFRAKRDTKNYSGELLMLTNDGEHYLGTNNIITSDIEYHTLENNNVDNNQNITLAKTELLRNIKTFKEFPVYHSFYKNTILKKYLSQTIVSRYDKTSKISENESKVKKLIK